jgi:hypothetical protein
MKHEANAVEDDRQNWLKAIAIYRHCSRCGRDLFADDFVKTMREECIPLDIDLG